MMVVISLIILEGMIILSSYTHPIVSNLYDFFLMQSQDIFCPYNESQ